MLLTSLLSQVPKSNKPMVDLSNCFSLQHPDQNITLAFDNQPLQTIQLPVIFDDNPHIQLNFRFQFEYPNMTYYVNPESDKALFSDYTQMAELKRDLESLDGAEAYFMYHDDVSGVGDTIKCFARFVPGTYIVDSQGYAHVRLF